MIKEILILLGMFVAGAIFMYFRSKIINKVKDTVKENTEVFDWQKFMKIFDIGNKVEWAKDISSLFNLRKLTIYALIIGAIFGYGYFKGRGDTPIQTNLDYDKEFVMNLNGEYLHKPKYSNDIYVKETGTGKILKHIKAKDLPLLKEKLKPVGFILEPIGVMGGGLGLDGGAFEAGAGISFLKYWKWKLDSFLTQKGIYAGTSYRITDNSGIGIGAGKGYKGDSRAILYYNFKF